ncbi:hypothetical protein F5Y18DRAFT_431210 [Xylariaceae sp. FL1019]|nr:hypothetical protein F5Y18DRAFT_431210 [Xylariaceae sp. FL1019]
MESRLTRIQSIRFTYVYDPLPVDSTPYVASAWKTAQDSKRRRAAEFGLYVQRHPIECDITEQYLLDHEGGNHVTNVRNILFINIEPVPTVQGEITLGRLFRWLKEIAKEETWDMTVVAFATHDRMVAKMNANLNSPSSYYLLTAVTFSQPISTDQPDIHTTKSIPRS